VHVQEIGSAVSAESTAIGVTIEKADFFDNFAAETHGFGKALPQRQYSNCRGTEGRACGDGLCGRCGRSTAGPQLSGEQRAGDAYDGEGEVPTRNIKTWLPDGTEGVRVESHGALDNSYNAEIAAGGERSAQALEDGPAFRLTTKSVEQLMHRDVDLNGRSSRSRKRTSGCSPDFGVLMVDAARGRLNYA